ECSPTAKRGMMTFLSEITYSSMCLFGMMLGTRQLLGDDLVALMTFAVPFCTFFFIALFFLPETPKFLLIARSNRPAAERSVRFYHGSDSDVDTVLKEIVMNTVALWSMLLSSIGFLIGCGMALIGAVLRLFAVIFYRPELLIAGRFLTS
ncbi:hypothetical protein ANCDUO_24422, partial [Ancylostoma duodenale]